MHSYKLSQNLMSVLPGLSENSEYFLGCIMSIMMCYTAFFLYEVNKESLP